MSWGKNKSCWIISAFVIALAVLISNPLYIAEGKKAAPAKKQAVKPAEETAASNVNIDIVPLLTSQYLRSRVFAPRVSPDNSWIAFEIQECADGGESKTAGSRNLRFFDRTAGRIREDFKIPNPDPFSCPYSGGLVWRPYRQGGTEPLAFAFVFNKGSRQNHDIYIGWIANEQLKVAQVTNDPAVDSHPVWSPDGKTLLFLSNRNRSRGADVYQVKISNLTAITPGKEQLLLQRENGIAFPSLSPTGQFLAYTSPLEQKDGSPLGILIQPLTPDESGYKPSGNPISVPNLVGKSFKICSWSDDEQYIAFYIGGQNVLDETAFKPDEERNDIGFVKVTGAPASVRVDSEVKSFGISVVDLRENSYTRGPVWLPNSHRIALITFDKEIENPIVIWDIDENKEQLRLTKSRINRDVSAFITRRSTGLCFTAHDAQVSNIFTALLPEVVQ